MRPTTNICFNEYLPLYLPPLLSFHSFSTLKALLTGSGEVPVYYIRRCRHQFESGRAGDKFLVTHFLTTTMLTVHLCGPPYLHDPSTCMGPFHPREAPSREIRGMVCPGSWVICSVWSPLIRVSFASRVTFQNCHKWCATDFKSFQNWVVFDGMSVVTDVMPENCEPYHSDHK